MKIILLIVFTVILASFSYAISSNATNDTFTDKASDTANYGSSTNIEIRSQDNGGGADFVEIGFFAFDLSGIGILSDANFSAYINTVIQENVAAKWNFTFCDDTFDEATLTWANQNTEVVNCDAQPFASIGTADIDLNKRIVVGNLTSKINDDSDKVFTIRVWPEPDNLSTRDYKYMSSSENANADQHPFVEYVEAPNTAPGYSGLSANNTAPKKNEDVLFQVNLTDDNGINSYTPAHNLTGTMANQSNVGISGTSYEVNYTLSITTGRGNVTAVQFWFDDNGGLENQTTAVSVTVANSPPPQVTTWNFPATSPDTDNQNVSFNWSEVIDADGDTVQYFLFMNISGPTMELVYNGTDSNWTTNISDGDYKYVVGTYDDLDFGVNSTQRTFTMDTQAPLNTFNYPTDLTIINNNTGFDINVTITDNLEVYHVNVSLYNSSNDIVYTNFTDDTNLSTFRLFEFINWTNQQDGNFTVQVRSFDSHSEPIDENNLKKGKKGDTINTFNDTSVDAYFEMGVYFVEKDQKFTDTPGDTIMDTYVSQSGTYKTDLNFTVLKPETKPVFNITSTKRIDYQRESSFAGHIVWLPYVTDFEKAKKISVNGIERTATINVTIISEFNIEVMIIPDTPLSGGDFVSIDPETLGLNQQENNITVTKDTATPHIQLSGGTTNTSWLSQNWIFVNISLNESNLKNITYYLYNQSNGLIKNQTYGNYTFFYNFTGLSDGNYTINVSAYDQTNLTNNSNSISGIALDTTIPVVNLENPPNGSISTANTIEFRYNFTEAHVSNATLFIDGILNDTNNTVFTDTSSQNFTKVIPLGSYNWTIMITDLAGNTANATIRYFFIIGEASTSESTSGGTPSSGSIPGYAVNSSGEFTPITQEESACLQQTSFLDRLKDSCKVENGLCEDGETPLSSPDCQLTSDSFSCNGERCIFNEIWFAKLLLIVGAFMLVRYKKDYNLILVFIAIFLIINFYVSIPSAQAISTDNTPQPLYTQEQIENSIILKYGSVIMPSNPSLGFALGVGTILFLLYYSVNEASTRLRKRGRR